MSEISNNPPQTRNDYLILATLILSGATTSIPLMLSGARATQVTKRIVVFMAGHRAARNFIMNHF
jgi:hypothetical protein